MPNGRRVFENRLYELRRRDTILGFFIDFQSKTMYNARAYLPSICSLTNNTTLVSLCPVRSMLDITGRGLVSGYFLRKLTQKKTLSGFLKNISGASSTVAPYTLRIGGRTWKLSNGMDRQLVDFLGTWKIPEASARYFRGNPRAVLLLVRRFYLSSDPFRVSRNGDNATGS